MNWEATGAIAEIAGVFLVVASLLYVARQLKQTTDMMRVTASNERVEREYDILNSLIENREVAEYWVKGGSNFEALDEVDRQRLIFFERKALVLWHHIYSLHQQGLYPDSDWHWNEWIIRNIGSRQAIRAAWNVFEESFEQPFRDYINKQFAIADSERKQP
jgi:hypothetical protein